MPDDWGWPDGSPSLALRRRLARASAARASSDMLLRSIGERRSLPSPPSPPASSSLSDSVVEGPPCLGDNERARIRAPLVFRRRRSSNMRFASSAPMPPEFIRYMFLQPGPPPGRRRTASPRRSAGRRRADRSSPSEGGHGVGYEASTVSRRAVVCVFPDLHAHASLICGGLGSGVHLRLRILADVFVR